MIDTNEIMQRLGYVPNEMQCEMIARGAQSEGLVLLSPTGSGKTLAYLLPLLQGLDLMQQGIQAIVVVPTRELAVQAEEMLGAMKAGVKAMSVYGGRPAMDEHRKMREVRPQVIFGTPGRLLDHLSKENILPHGVKTLVIDEYDKCLEMGFRQEVGRLMQEMAGAVRMWMTSATRMSDFDEFVSGQRVAIGSRKRQFAIVDHLGEDSAATNRIEVKCVPSPEKDKLTTMLKLVSALQGQQAILFVAHRESAERVGDALKREGFASVVYHGGMEQEHRERALYKLRNQSVNIMVATDIAARGLDIPEVRHIIHYHLPIDEATFTHRSGRTARWDASGYAYLIVGPQEQLPEYVGEVAEMNVDDVSIRPSMPEMVTLYIGRGKKEKLSKMDVLGFLCKKGKLTNSDVGRIDVAAHYSLVAVKRECVKPLLRQVAGEKIKGMKTIIEVSGR